jgi:hypothetical protein
MVRRITVVALGVALLGGCVTGTDAVVEPTIAVTQPEPIAASEDPFNVAALSGLGPGMIVEIRVSPAGIELQQAFMMLTPRTVRSADVPGDRIVATLSGGGTQVSQTATADSAVVIVESFDERGVVKGEIVRQDDRTVSLALPTPRRVDTLEVTVTSTGVTERFDVSDVMDGYCATARSEPSCERASKPLR